MVKNIDSSKALLSALIRLYSSSPKTDLYIAAKSMTGTVRVLSMSNTTPLRRDFALVVRFAMEIEEEEKGLSVRETNVLDKRKIMVKAGTEGEQRRRRFHGRIWRRRATTTTISQTET